MLELAEPPSEILEHRLEGRSSSSSSVVKALGPMKGICCWWYWGSCAGLVCVSGGGESMSFCVNGGGKGERRPSAAMVLERPRPGELRLGEGRGLKDRGEPELLLSLLRRRRSSPSFESGERGEIAPVVA
jgi:hypothetical protein